MWSDDPKDKCLVCGALKSQCRCKPQQSSTKSYNFIAVFRIEKNRRGGKIVTVIDQLPKQEIFLKELTKELKSKCGSGGTYSTTGKEGVIEIQGDQRQAIKAIFDKKGYKYKGM